MKLVNLIEEDFTNYKKPGMFLGFSNCSGKCNIEAGKIVCQNADLCYAPIIDISAEEILKRYSKNKVSKCLILGGLEPFDSFDDMLDLVTKLRNYCSWKTDFDYGYFIHPDDPIVIYTGYYPFEVGDKLRKLTSIDRGHGLMIKFGRYIPGHKSHYDPILGVYLASDNQYALEYSWEEAGPVWNNSFL